MKARDASLDAVKGFAILLVMLGHCIVLNHMEDGYIYDAIKAVQMPLFMAAGGYLAGKTLHIGSKKELLWKLGKRAVSYLVPFVSWIFILHVTDFPKRFVMALFYPDTALWFLLTLFILTVVLYAAVYIKECSKLGWWGFFLTVGAAGILTGIQYLAGNSFLGPHLTLNYLPFFIGAYLIGVWNREGRRMAGGKMTAACVASAVLFVGLIVRFDMIYAHNRMEWLIQLFASAIGTMVCFYGVYHIAGGKVKTFLSRIGRYTLEIYVLHFHFATILGMQNAGLSLYEPKGIGTVLLTFILMSVLTAFFIFTLKKLWITDFLLFGKGKSKTAQRPIE